MNNKPYIEIKQISDLPGIRYRAMLFEGSSGKGRFGDTAAIAEARLREAENCEGVEARMGTFRAFNASRTEAK